jgi:hypothetical protein
VPSTLTDASPSTTRSRRSPALVWGLAFVLLFGLGVSWALTNPPLVNSDEPAHAVKATALWRGQILPPKQPLPDEGPGSLIRGAFTTNVTVPGSYGRQTAKDPECFIWDSRIPAGCMPGWVDDPNPVAWTSYIGRYPPTYYSFLGWTTRLSTGLAGYYGMRVVSAALNAALLASAFALTLLDRRFRFLGMALLIACTPEVLLLAGSINPNSLEIAAGVLAWTSVCAAVLWKGPVIPRQVLVAAAVSCSLLALTRPLSDLWLAIIGLGTLAIFGERDRVFARLRQRDIRIVIGIVGVAGVLGAIWTVISDDLGNNRGYNPWGLTLVPAVQHSLALSWSYLQQMVAVFGWDRTPSPAPLTWAWGIALLALLVPAFRAADRRRRIGLATLGVVVFLVPTALQAPTAEAIGFVWSGRYWLAVICGVPIVAALILGEGPASGRGPRAPWSRRTGLLVAVIVAGGQVVAHAAAMRRWTVGTDGPLQYLGKGNWAPPVPSWFLLVATAALSAGLATLGYVLAFHDDDRAEPGVDADRLRPGDRYDGGDRPQEPAPAPLVR